MDETDFTLAGERHHLTREQVILAMQDQEPGTIRTYAVDVEGRHFPVKQVLAESLHIPSRTFISTRAQAILSKLDFLVWDVGTGSPDAPSDHAEREQALSLAIRFFGSGTESDVPSVLRIARDFDRWLRGAKRS